MALQGRRCTVMIVGIVWVSWGQLASAEVLQYGDGTADGKRSFGGGGHLIMLTAPKDQMWLNRIEMFGSRYGMSQPPDEDFHVYIVNADRQILRVISLPYLLWQRGAEYWRNLPLPPVRVPQEFGIGMTFNAQQTKGVYVGTDAASTGHSFSWLPGQEGKPMENLDWMVRATVADAPEGDPKASDLVIQPDGSAFFDQFVGASGDPLIIILAGRGKLPKTEISSIRVGAAAAPVAGDVVLHLLNGMKVEGKIITVNDKVIRLRVGDAEREIARADIARIDFR